jgi:hypothetical protein
MIPDCPSPEKGATFLHEIASGGSAVSLPRWPLSFLVKILITIARSFCKKNGNKRCAFGLRRFSGSSDCLDIRKTSAVPAK